MAGITNGYVEKLGKKILDKYFVGVFPCDLHPVLGKKKKMSLIFNLSKHNSDGSHFIAIYTNKNHIIYFDSFGKKCSNKYILKFINKNKKNRPIIYNRKNIQSSNSSFCGFFCLAFILSQKLNIPLKTHVKMYNSKNLMLNDKIVIDYIEKNI